MENKVEPIQQENSVEKIKHTIYDTIARAGTLSLASTIAVHLVSQMIGGNFTVPLYVEVPAIIYCLHYAKTGEFTQWNQ